MSQKKLKKVKLKVHGMHCASCEVLIERRWKEIGGVCKVHVNHATGRAELYCFEEPDISVLEEAIKKDGYRVSLWFDTVVSHGNEMKNTKKDYIQIVAMFLVIFVGYLVFKRFDLLPRLGISDGMSYGFVFLIGFVAALSTCLAVT
ncbi:MAG: heavy metal translocating P-type ATPase, partial [Parcubacteria group bacterium]|nr:heavy metal translocating P-type ATPase [Parcubacteria group bacterium]